MKNDNVALVSLAQGHLKKTFVWLQDKQLRHDFRFYREITWEDHVSWFENSLNDSSLLNFAIYNNDNGAHIGNCGLKHIDAIKQRCELWIYIGEKHDRGKGIGTSAVDLLTKYALDKLGMEQIYLHVAQDNIAARRIYEKLGYEKKEIPPNGEWENESLQDIIYMEKS